MNKKYWQVSVAIIFLFTGCTPSETSRPVIITQNATTTPFQNSTSTQYISLSKTARESRNEPTVTPIPASTTTPTFDVSMIVTVTPELVAKCPQTNSQVKLEISRVQGYVPETKEIAPPILNFLNQGGDINKLIQMVNQVYGRGRVIVGLLQDLTNDSVFEVIIKYPGLLIFTCDNGQYWMAYEKGGLAIYQILDDLNKNGIPEILSYSYIFGPGSLEMEVQEWNGKEFKSLGNLGIGGAIEKGFEITDWDGNGLKEFILKGDVPGLCCEAEINPWRVRTSVYGWNGSNFEEVYRFLGAPQYRFQAIQDADREILYKNTKTALTL